MYFLIPKCPVRWWRTRIIFLSRFQRRGSYLFRSGRTDGFFLHSIPRTNLRHTNTWNPQFWKSHALYLPNILWYPNIPRLHPRSVPARAVLRHLFFQYGSPCPAQNPPSLRCCHIYPENLWTTSKHTDTAFLIQAALNSTVHWSCHCQWSDRDRFRSMSPPLHPLPPLYLPLSLSPDYNTVQSRPVLSAVHIPLIKSYLK